ELEYLLQNRRGPDRHQQRVMRPELRTELIHAATQDARGCGEAFELTERILLPETRIEEPRLGLLRGDRTGAPDHPTAPPRHLDGPADGPARDSWHLDTLQVLPRHRLADARRLAHGGERLCDRQVSLALVQVELQRPPVALEGRQVGRDRHRNG